ncbi:MAG TPA: hypothetical protein VGC51_07275 [Hansschlegelia sp.]
MTAVIFEVTPAEGRAADYLAMAMAPIGADPSTNALRIRPVGRPG